MGGMVNAVVLTAVFAILGLHALVRAAGNRRRPLDLVGDLLHVLMCAGMIAMSWSWWSALPAVPQIVLYAVAAGWFVLLALLQVAEGVESGTAGGPDAESVVVGGPSGAPRSRPDRPARGHGPLHQAQHAAMMLAMVWMVLVMAEGPSSAGDTGGAGHAMAALSPAASLLGVVFTAVLAVSGLLVLAQAHESGPPRTGLRMMAAMDLAMAFACWLMLLH